MKNLGEVVSRHRRPLPNGRGFLYSRREAEEDKEKLKVIVFILAVVLTFSPVSAAPTQDGTPYPPMPPQAGVAYAVASMYAPMGNETFWITSLCSQMTSGGCDYFQRKQANALWRLGQGVRGDTASRAEVVAEIPPRSQVWKMTVTIWKDEETAYDVYVLAQQNDGGQWLLDRVLYGPYLGFSK